MTQGSIALPDPQARNIDKSFEFELVVGADRKFDVPPDAAGILTPGRRFYVRLTERSVEVKLRQRAISHETINRMSDLQREPKENILRFLLAEGRLKTDRAFRRAAGKFRRGSMQ